MEKPITYIGTCVPSMGRRQRGHRRGLNSNPHWSSASQFGQPCTDNLTVTHGVPSRGAMVVTA